MDKAAGDQSVRLIPTRPLTIIDKHQNTRTFPPANMPDSLPHRSIPAPNGYQHIHKVLIANRGEIACRIIRTLNQLGLTTVCIYTKADRGSLHVKYGDEVWVLPGPDGIGYLDEEAILGVARKAGVQAIVPGYGESLPPPPTPIRAQAEVSREGRGFERYVLFRHEFTEPTASFSLFLLPFRLLIRKRRIRGKGRKGGVCLGWAFV